MTVIANSYGLLSDEDLVAFEAKSGLVLPPKYRAFLLRNNGGQPVPDSFQIPGWGGVDSCVQRFFGIHDGTNSNLDLNIKFYANRIPRPFIPIGIDPAGNILCVGYEHSLVDCVYFWDYEDELDENGESKLDMSNMYLVAESIDELCDSLR